jgi:hypothetical protein
MFDSLTQAILLFGMLATLFITACFVRDAREQCKRFKADQAEFIRRAAELTAHSAVCRACGSADDVTCEECEVTVTRRRSCGDCLHWGKECSTMPGDPADHCPGYACTKQKSHLAQ